MPRRRSINTMETDARAAELFRRGLSYRAISAELGWASPNAAVEAVRRAAKDAARDSVANADALQIMLDRLQDYRQRAWEVANATHYATSPAGVVRHPDTEDPLLDDAPVLQALDRLAKFDDIEAKLRGIYAPTRTRVEVVPEEVVDAEIAALEDEVGEAGAADPGTA